MLGQQSNQKTLPNRQNRVVDFGWVWDPASLMEGDFILPEQLRGNGNRSGEIDLLIAVFEDGVRTYCEKMARGSTTSPEYLEVEDWILRSESDAITSFASLCELFGIDAQRMRGVLRGLGSRTAIPVSVRRLPMRDFAYSTVFTGGGS
jgi:hypothetical protein